MDDQNRPWVQLYESQRGSLVAVLENGRFIETVPPDQQNVSRIIINGSGLIAACTSNVTGQGLEHKVWPYDRQGWESVPVPFTPYYQCNQLQIDSDGSVWLPAYEHIADQWTNLMVKRFDGVEWHTLEFPSPKRPGTLFLRPDSRQRAYGVS